MTRTEIFAQIRLCNNTSSPMLCYYKNKAAIRFFATEFAAKGVAFATGHKVIQGQAPESWFVLGV